jgi:hypothetical protein
MNIGEFKDKVSVLSLKQTGNNYAWEQLSDVWSKTERLISNNLFSKAGINARSIRFTIRKKSNLTLHNAFIWRDMHCFLTDMVCIDGMYYEVTAVLIEPWICTVERTGRATLDELNRPAYGNIVMLTFPGCLIEKYLGYTQGEPMASTEARYMLITPKVIDLVAGEIVKINDKAYTVIVPHTIDDYKNEYEIIVKEDA